MTSISQKRLASEVSLVLLYDIIYDTPGYYHTGASEDGEWYSWFAYYHDGET